ncbi:hypothetical protein VZ94_14910 [Methylocucumis oryzae]|uniref:Uncharacterized protein n=1 Tax=Methylocucumis oryzae TaxID=1632867 RepID=A0A0F3IGG2_9GAMM|nr:hypothetical protein VZ94_14910 [Methylocucumis oryzae]
MIPMLINFSPAWVIGISVLSFTRSGVTAIKLKNRIINGLFVVFCEIFYRKPNLHASASRNAGALHRHSHAERGNDERFVFGGL